MCHSASMRTIIDKKTENISWRSVSNFDTIFIIGIEWCIFAKVSLVNNANISPCVCDKAPTLGSQARTSCHIGLSLLHNVGYVCVGCSICTVPIWLHYRTWWCHDMETISALLALYDGNPPITDKFPSQRTSNVELWCFPCCELAQVGVHSAVMPIIWDVATLIWRHFNGTVVTSGPSLWIVKYSFKASYHSYNNNNSLFCQELHMVFSLQTQQIWNKHHM